MSKQVLALIPARAGSKGVVGKNKRLLGGKPLIVYSVDCAIESEVVTHVAISTDDSDIIALYEDISGVRVIRRPEEMATDKSSVIDAIVHALEVLKEKGLSFGCIVLLQPTSPFRKPTDIDKAVEKYWANSHQPLCSVCECGDYHPARMYDIKQNTLNSLHPELSSIRRQDLPPVYHRNGAMYIFSEKQLREGGVIHENMTPYVMPEIQSINIDTELDFRLAELVVDTEV